ncbi:ketosteroid isomerase family protein [Kovacikia minuta CCNUW1]|uniref:nuclear transport factor 2 family protein n=1 Tax=Kovacikia minuta TaxID=2931930 RepID=UPI001CCC5893|nr:nuclear transport factor 2 family protein [Kovacikia minuta]UBF26883.1 ketosteroid isomerase family protein [Kovacikia minuta CCNUW1]
MKHANSPPSSVQISPEIETASIASETRIEGIDEPVVLRYFQTLNQGEFTATSNLFGEDGILVPPFEAAIEGRAAIAAYLEKEAQGLVLHPQKGTSKSQENGFTEFQIVGKVQTSLFLVNVCWDFLLNPAGEISSTKINLLASLQELLNLKGKNGETEKLGNEN